MSISHLTITYTLSFNLITLLLAAVGWMTTREDWAAGRCEPGSIRRCGLKTVTDRLYSHYFADADIKWIKPNLIAQHIKLRSTHLFDNIYEFTRFWQCSNIPWADWTDDWSRSDLLVENLGYLIHSHVNNLGYIAHSPDNNLGYIAHSPLNNREYVTHSATLNYDPCR